MPRQRDRDSRTSSRVISRRELLRILAAAGLLAGCGQAERLVPPTGRPTDRPAPAPSTAPTARPTSPPTAAPTEAPPTTEPTTAPTAEPTSPPPPPLSRVVCTRHAGVWAGDALVPEVIGEMLDASIVTLTGLDDPDVAWASRFAPGERAAIKVNTIGGSSFWTHLPLVMAVAERLQRVGIPPEQIVIFDRVTSELENAGFPVNRDGPGVRCYGTDWKYTEKWTLMGEEIGLSDVLVNCDALINIPVLKTHSMSGISFAMKNHYGTFDRPGSFHGSRIVRALAELNALPPIKDRTRLIIGDALTIVHGSWGSAEIGDSLLMSLDPVAHDSVGLDMYCEVMYPGVDHTTTRAYNEAAPWLQYGAEIGLGSSDAALIDLREVNLG